MSANHLAVMLARSLQQGSDGYRPRPDVRETNFFFMRRGAPVRIVCIVQQGPSSWRVELAARDSDTSSDYVDLALTPPQLVAAFSPTAP